MKRVFCTIALVVVALALAVTPAFAATMDESLTISNLTAQAQDIMVYVWPILALAAGFALVRIFGSRMLGWIRALGGQMKRLLLVLSLVVAALTVFATPAFAAGIFPSVASIFGGAVTYSVEIQNVLIAVLGLMALFYVVNLGFKWLGARAAGRRRK